MAVLVGAATSNRRSGPGAQVSETMLAASGAAALPGRMGCGTPLDTVTASIPPDEVTNAISFPSGDHASPPVGLTSGPWTTRRRPFPSASTTSISELRPDPGE